MFCSRISNNMISKVHERPLRVRLNDHQSDFETLLQNNNDVCNHHRNIQTRLIEIFKVKKGFAPQIMGSIPKGRKNTYNVRNFQEFETKKKDCIFWSGNFSYISPQLWSLLLEQMKQLYSKVQFKTSARQWVCKVYL